MRFNIQNPLDTDVQSSFYSFFEEREVVQIKMKGEKREWESKSQSQFDWVINMETKYKDFGAF